MDANSLRNTARDKRDQAAKLHADAAAAMQIASAYTQNNDLNGAQREHSKSTSFVEKAQRLEQEAMAAEQNAQDKERQISTLQEQQAQIRQEAERRINDLESQKQSLQGSTGGFF